MKKILLLCLPLLLSAHALRLFITKEDGFLHIKSYFTASSPCMECKIVIKTKDNKTLEYTTDTKGELKIPLNIKPVSVLADGGLGHQKKVVLEKQKKVKNKLLFPLWLKALIAIFSFILFFIGLRMVKK